MVSENEEFEFRARAEKEAATKKPGTDWKGIIGDSVKNMFVAPARALKDAGTNPVTMANLAPAALGTLGAVSPVPGGATLGTGLGQGMRDLALKALKEPLPSGLQHGLELGGSALADVAAIPFMKAKVYGSAIGNAEKAAGVTTRAPMRAVTPGSVGKTLNNLEAAIDSGRIATPQMAKDAKAVVSQVYKNPKIYEQTPEITVQAQRVSAKVSELINKLVPGRAEPAQKMAQAMKIPNALKKGYMSLPWALRHGAEGAVGAAAGWEGIKKLLGQ